MSCVCMTSENISSNPKDNFNVHKCYNKSYYNLEILKNFILMPSLFKKKLKLFFKITFFREVLK